LTPFVEGLVSTDYKYASTALLFPDRQLCMNEGVRDGKMNIGFSIRSFWELLFENYIC